MGRHLIILAACICFTWRASAQSTGTANASDAAHDIGLEEKVTFSVEESDAGYGLTSLCEVAQTYLSGRSTDDNVFTIAEQYFDSVTNITGSFRHESLPSRSFSYRYSDGEDVFLSDYKAHFIQFPHDIDTGETVYYTYEKDYKELAYIPLVTVPNTDYVSSFQVVVNHPENIDVDFEFFFPRSPLEYKITKEDARTTTLKFSNIYQDDPLPYFPFDDQQATIQIRLRKGSQYLTPKTAKDFTGIRDYLIRARWSATNWMHRSELNYRRHPLHWRS